MQIRFRSGCGLAAVAMVLAWPAAAQVRTIDIPAQPLPAALAALGRQARLQIVAPADGLETVRSAAIRGTIEPRVALHRLIAGSGRVSNTATMLTASTMPMAWKASL